MKRTICTLLVISLLLVAMLTGCAGKTEDPATNNTGTSEGTATEVEVSEDIDYTKLEGELVIWTFDTAFESQYTEAFEKIKAENPDFNLVIEVLEYDALYEKFNTIILAGGEDGPDLIDVEEGKFGTYTKGEVPFVPLNSYLAASGKEGAAVEGRLGLYSSGGNYYGAPHQLCPVTLVINKKLMDENGIEYPFETWDDFIAAGKELKEKTGVYMTGMTDNSGNWKNTIEVILKSTEHQMVNPDGSPNINTAEFKQVAEMVKGWCKDDEIAMVYENWTDYWAGPAKTEFACFYAADWTAGHLRNSAAPDQLDTYIHIPLPRLTADGANTSSWGGTGMAISKYSENQELAYKFLYNTMFDTDYTVEVYKNYSATPPLHEALASPEIAIEVEYFCNQNVMELYGELAKVMPPTYQSWWRPSLTEAIGLYWQDFYDDVITVDEFAEGVQGFIEDKIADEA